MGVLSKKAIALAYVTAVGALIATPSVASVVMPTDTTAVWTTSPFHSVYDSHGASGLRHHQRPASWGWKQRRFRLRR
jgi:hypothetical protein